MPRLFVIGGSDAGISAALRARELAADWEVSVAVADRFPNYSICGIPYYLSREVAHPEDLAHRKTDDIRKLGIDLLLEHRAISFDPAERKVVVTGPGGAESVERYDRLIVGTGAASIRPPIKGGGLPGVFFLRWIGDALAFSQFLDERAPRAVAIVGGGYIGLEVAEALRRRMIEVTIVEMAPSVMPTIDADLGEKVGGELERNGIKLDLNRSVSSIVSNGGRLRLESPVGSFVDADMVLVAVGARPETSIAKAAGLATGFKGALQVSRRMETNVPGVFAAGDCAETWHRITQKGDYLPLGTTAHKQGRIAGENAVGGDRQFDGVLGTQSVRLFDLVIARTGFHDRDAREAGFDPLSVDSAHWDHGIYYPGAKTMEIRVTGDRASGRLLGAQIIGGYGTEVSKRIDVFAAAIHNGATVEQLNDLDLSYTPPLSSPWDPVQMAGQAWSKEQIASKIVA